MDSNTIKSLQEAYQEVNENLLGSYEMDKTLTEDPVQDYRDYKRSKENASGVRGPELSHSVNSSGGSAAQKPKPRSREFEKVLPQPRSREFSHGGGTRPLKSVVKGGLTMSHKLEGDQLDEFLGGVPGDGYIGHPNLDIKNPLARTQKKEKVLPKAAPGSGGIVNRLAATMGDRNSQLKNSYEPDAFDIILEYLVAEGYADTNKAAISIMANMSEEWRQSIIEQSNTLVTPEQRRADELKYGMKRTTPVSPPSTNAAKKQRRMPL